MPDPSSIAEAPGAADPDRAARLMAAVDELAEVGMELVRALKRDVAEGRLAAVDAAVAFERLSRAVRLTIVLAQRLEAGIEIPADAGAPAVATQEAPSVEVEQLERTESVEGLERLSGERGDLNEGAWLTKPIWLLAARICADLRVPYDAALWGDGGADVLPAHIISAHPRESGDPGFLSSSAGHAEKRLGPLLRGDERVMDRAPRYRPP
jgi:hypothetical protein